jgi:hypothetical protein
MAGNDTTIIMPLFFMYSYSGAPNTAKEQNTAGRVTFETGSMRVFHKS